MASTANHGFSKQIINIFLIKFLMIQLISCTIPNKESSPCNVNHFSALTPTSSSLTTITSSLQSLTLDGHIGFKNNHFAATDFGNIYHSNPLAVLHPKTVSDISKTLKHVSQEIMGSGNSELITVAARGHGHSIQGQAQADQGLVIDMESFQRQEEESESMKVVEMEGYVEVSGGELWINVLHETLKHGLAPKSWTDYLYLSVGGTLSNAGISGQSFRHGPQTSNVLQLQVVTGKGDIVTCSEKQNSELFYAVLGGLGQFGIITRAQISLQIAPKTVKWIRALYSDFSTFSMDQEHLISSKDTFDYVEGFVIKNRTGLLNNWRSSFSPKDPHQATLFKSDGRTLYCLEVAKYFNPDETDTMNEKVESLLSKLSYIPSTVFQSEVSYVEFLDRVHVSEKKLRENGLWEIPHPWLNLFIPKSRIHHFAEEVFGKMLTDTANGPIIIYPLDKSKWIKNTSFVAPDEDIFYVVAFLPSALPDSGGKDGLDHILAQNAKIKNYCIKALPGCKQYLPHYTTEEEWRAHFGQQWLIFVQRKSAYDPLAILAPGQAIFKKSVSFS